MRTSSRRCRSLLVILDADAVVDQERRATVDHRVRSRWAVWLMVDLERLLWPVSARPAHHWLGMFGTDGSVVGVTIVCGLWGRYKL